MSELLPPQNIEAEQSVLGAILIDNAALDLALEHITLDDFYRESHRNIFQAMIGLADKGEAIDIITLGERVGEQGYLADLAAAIPTAANIAHHAKIVADKAAKRKILNSCREAISLISEDAELDDILTGLTVDVRQNKRGMITLKDLIEDVQRAVELRYETPEVIAGVPSGISDLDLITDGFQPQDLIYVGGRPGMGKTALAWTFAEAAARHGDIPIMENIEMANRQMGIRAVAIKSGVNQTLIRKARLDKDGWDKFYTALSDLSELKMLFDDDIGNLSDLTKSITQGVRRGGTLAIVDYLQLLRSTRKENREQEIAEISRTLKQTAKKLNIPIIALVQLNRGVELRADKRPMLADIRESGSIEQDADIIMFLYREYYYLKQANKHNTPEAMECINDAELIVSKGRNVPTDTIMLKFYGETTEFKEA